MYEIAPQPTNSHQEIQPGRGYEVFPMDAFELGYLLSARKRKEIEKDSPTCRNSFVKIWGADRSYFVKSFFSVRDNGCVPPSQRSRDLWT